MSIAIDELMERHADLLAQYDIRWSRDEVMEPDNYYAKLAKHDKFNLPWMHDLADPEFNKKSYWISGLPNEKTQPAPINLVRHIMREMLQRPEVVKAYEENAKLPHDYNSSYDPEPPELIFLTYYKEYLRHKYGTLTRAVGFASGSVADMMRGEYSGPDDPVLLEYMKSRRSYIDDGVNYDR